MFVLLLLTIHLYAVDPPVFTGNSNVAGPLARYLFLLLAA